MLNKFDEQSRRAAQQSKKAAQTQAALNEKELYREAHKSDT